MVDAQMDQCFWQAQILTGLYDHQQTFTPLDCTCDKQLLEKQQDFGWLTVSNLTDGGDLG